MLFCNLKEDDYISNFHNERIKLNLNGLSPVQYWVQAISTAI
ncbi:IS3 family transposase [Xenorhabdus koppenhoeferi]